MYLDLMASLNIILLFIIFTEIFCDILLLYFTFSSFQYFEIQRNQSVQTAFNFLNPFFPTLSPLLNPPFYRLYLPLALRNYDSRCICTYSYTWAPEQNSHNIFSYSGISDTNNLCTSGNCEWTQYATHCAHDSNISYTDTKGCSKAPWPNIHNTILDIEFSCTSIH